MWKYYKNIVNVTLFLKISSQILVTNFFFPSHFQQWHCYNSIQFFFPFSAMPLPQLPNFFFFFSYFGNGIAAIVFFAQDRQEFGQRNFGNSVAEILLFSLSTFLSFSLLIFVEFQQHCCRNSFSFLNSPINFKQYL